MSLLLRERCGITSTGGIRDGLARLRGGNADIAVVGVTAEVLRTRPRVITELQAALPDRPLILLGIPATAPRDMTEPVTLLKTPVSTGEVLREIESAAGDASWMPRFSEPVLRAIDHVAEHYGSLTLHDLGWAVGLAPYYLSHQFSADIGVRLRTYLTILRAEVARFRLTETDESIDAIAARVGLHDASHLSRVFKACVGRRPGIYRKITREAERDAS